MTSKEKQTVKKEAVSVFFILAALFFLIHGALRLHAAAVLPPSTDEPDDVAMIFRDASAVMSFFDGVSEPDQARLPFVISAPFVAYFGETACVFPLRALFLVFYFGYIWLSYKLIFFVIKSIRAALLYALLLLFSCYLAGFSVFAVTTAGWLYALFHILVIYSFWKRCENGFADGVFARPIALAGLIGLCTASKLFGLLLFPPFIIFHWMNTRGKQIRILGENPRRIFVTNSLFIGWLGVVNLMPAPAPLKLFLGLALAALYLARLVRHLVTEERRKEAHAMNMPGLWGLMMMTAFCVTVIFSPIYLNLINVVRPLGWFEAWNTGSFIEKHSMWDMPVIIAIKFGLISLAALAPVIVIQLKDYKISKNSFSVFISLIFLTQFLVISVTRFTSTWYPLTIFPFLYLPAVFFYERARTRGGIGFKRLCFIVLCVIFLDNSARYVYWYPYSHFDGGQYGKNQVGWNKSAMVSFEMFPELLSFFQSLDASSHHRINIQACYVPHYNNWVVRMLRRRLGQRGRKDIELVEEAPGPDSFADYLVTSPVYNPELEQKVEALGYIRVKEITIKKIEMVSIWKPSSR